MTLSSNSNIKNTSKKKQKTGLLLEQMSSFNFQLVLESRGDGKAVLCSMCVTYVVFGFSEVHGTENPEDKRQPPDAPCWQESAIQKRLLDRKMRQKVDPNSRRVAQVRTELFKNEFLHSLLCDVAYWM